MTVTLILLMAGVIGLGAGTVSAQIVNPGFESGLTGWTAIVNGDAIPVTVASGSTSTSAGTIPPSLTGDQYVYTSQNGPGRSFVYQGFTVQPGTNRIFFDIAVLNGASSYYVPSPMSFDYSGAANQQARFDILAPGASYDTVNPSDILVTGFQTQPGDPLTSPWQSYDIDVSTELAPYTGQTVTLRFVQVDNQMYFNLAIDNLSVGASPPTNDPPTADANGPYSGNVGDTIVLDGSGSSDSDGTITGYAWNINGNSYSGVSPSVGLGGYAPGTYTVTLTVTDDDGATDSDTSSLTVIQPNTPPTADAGGPYSGNVGDTITLDGSGSSDADGTITDYAWTIGSNNYSGMSPSVNLSGYTSGTYTVTLTVTDDDGATDSDTSSLSVNAPPTADAGGPYSGNAGETITLDGSGSSDADGTITDYAWTIGSNNYSGMSPSVDLSGYTSGTHTVTLTVTDDDGATDSDTSSLLVFPRISITDSSAIEGDSGSTPATFTITLDAAVSATVTVNWATADGSATAGADYAAASGTVTFLPMDTSETISVDVLGDLLDEPDQTFFVNLSAPSNGSIVDGQGVGTITDDDPTPSISIADVTVDESDGAATVELTLTDVSEQMVTVSFDTADGTAAAGSDYTATSTTVSWPAATDGIQTVDIPIIDDSEDDDTETFAVDLSSPANATIGDDQAIVTIEDDDLIVNTTDDHNDGACTSADCSLREAILAANARPQDDLIRF
ncbi:MAG: PKD domain-containing protein, partial [Thermoanaerobaculales bacterium]|nr:PKD domain-containing protein [Thermoanaerobaculales bacterium]